MYVDMVCVCTYGLGIWVGTRVWKLEAGIAYLSQSLSTLLTAARSPADPRTCRFG